MERTEDMKTIYPPQVDSRESNGVAKTDAPHSRSVCGQDRTSVIGGTVPTPATSLADQNVEATDPAKTLPEVRTVGTN